MDLKHLLYLQINCAYPPEANLKVLRCLLQERHKAVKGYMGKPTIDPLTGEHTFPFHPRKNPPIRNVQAWLKYFQCYDLRTCQGLAYGQIARQIYGAQHARDTAEKAVDRVERLIRAAEQNAWPPTNPTR